MSDPLDYLHIKEPRSTFLSVAKQPYTCSAGPAPRSAHRRGRPIHRAPQCPLPPRMRQRAGMGRMQPARACPRCGTFVWPGQPHNTCGWRIRKSCGDRSLIQPPAMFLPTVGREVFSGCWPFSRRLGQSSFQAGVGSVSIIVMLEPKEFRLQICCGPE